MLSFPQGGQQEETTQTGAPQEKQEEQACNHSNLKHYRQPKDFLDHSRRAWAHLLGFPLNPGCQSKKNAVGKDICCGYCNGTCLQTFLLPSFSSSMVLLLSELSFLLLCILIKHFIFQQGKVGNSFDTGKKGDQSGIPSHCSTCHLVLTGLWKELKWLRPSNHHQNQVGLQT